MIAVFALQDGQTRQVEQIDPAWLAPDAAVVFWVDLWGSTDDELRILAELFRFHPLSIEDARSALQYPKVEAYPGYLYLVLHRIDSDEARLRRAATRDIDFFVGRNYLVTVHDGQSQTLGRLRDACGQYAHMLAEGPVALMHRIVDVMVDNYRPVMAALEDRLEALEADSLAGRTQTVTRVLRMRRELATLRRVLVPQRDAVARLARREFPAISDELAFRFRDVYDHLVRLTEEVIMLQDRLTGALEVNLASVSNRLNQIMKVLTVMSTIFLPLTVVTSMWGMNVPLPHFPGGEGAQFWWVAGLMAVTSLVMLGLFRLGRWI